METAGDGDLFHMPNYLLSKGNNVEIDPILCPREWDSTVFGLGGFYLITDD